MLIRTDLCHSQRHIANPAHGSGVCALIRMVCLSERSRTSPFPERWLPSWGLVEVQERFGLPDARHHIFVEGLRILQALEPDCEI